MPSPLSWLRAPKSTRFYGSIDEARHFHRAAADFIGSFPPDARILDVGSGFRRWGPSVVNVDLRPYPETDVAADAHALPFRDGAFDGAILQGSLAYVRDPQEVAREVARVLKEGGRVYADENQVYPDDPTDAAIPLVQRWRFTPAGLAEVFSTFDREAAGPCMGPASALAMQLRWVLALLLSLGSERTFRAAWHAAGWLVFPLKWLDPLFEGHPLAVFAAGNCYFRGRKRPARGV